MRKIATLSGIMTLAMAAAVSTAIADNPHFVGNTVCSATSESLTVSGKLAGLGDNQGITIVVEASATTRCLNRGGHFPPGQTRTVSGSEELETERNGSVSFSVTTDAVANSCPRPMIPETTFANVKLTVLDENGNRLFQASVSCS
jgi:hypothetical protein